MLKANFSGDPSHYVLESESSTSTVNSQKTPSTITYNINNTDLRVYDTVGFTIRLNYTYDSVTDIIANAPVYLELWDGSTWSTVDTKYTDQYGYATLTYRFDRNGTYTFRIHYPGNDTFTEYISGSITLLVKSLATNILLESVPSNGVAGSSMYVVVRLVDEKGRSIAGETVVLQKQVDTGWIDVASAVTGSDGSATLSWSEDTAGIYTYRVVYNGKDYVYNSSVSPTFTVNVSTVTTGLTLTANTTSTYINETVQLVARLVNNSEPVVGRLIIFQVAINGSWITLGNDTTDSNGYALFNTTMRYAGNYTYRAVFEGDETYAPATGNNLTVEYKPIPTTITVNIPSTVYTTQSFTVTIVLEKTSPYSGPLSGEPVRLWISNDGASWSLVGMVYTDSTGTAVFHLAIDTPGTYYLKANYSDPGRAVGEWEYDDSESSIKTLIVVKNTLTITLTVNDTSPYAKSYIEFTAHVTRDNDTQPVSGLTIELQVWNGAVWVTIASSTTNITGYAVFIIDSGYVGNYTYRAYYSGSNIYAESASNEVNVSVQPIPTTLTLSAPTTVYAGEYFNLTARLLNSLNGSGISGYTVYFYRSLDGISWEYIGSVATNSSGYAVLTWVENSSGTYYYKANFTDPGKDAGMQIYNESESNIVTVTVNKIATQLTLTANTTSTYINEPVELRAVLTTSGGEPISGEPVSFYVVNGGTPQLLGVVTTNSLGEAVLVITSTALGNYTYYAEYAGSDMYASSRSNNVTVEYSKRPVTIEVISIVPETPGINDTITITVRVTSLGKPLSVDLYLYNGSILVDVETSNGEGYAVFTVSFTSVGVYNLSIRYLGSDIYQPAEANITITVSYRVNLTLNVTYTVLTNGSLLFRLEAHLYIEGKPFANQVIYFYKKGSWILIGSNTTDSNGTAILYYVEKQPVTGTYVFKAEYNSTTPTIRSAAINQSITVTEITPPVPEPPVALILSAAIITYILIYNRRRRA